MTLRARLTGLAATLAIVGIVIALPIALVAVGANPLPETWSTLDIGAALTSPDDGTLALGVLKLLGWALWLYLTVSIAAEIVARVRGVRPPQVRGQLLARGLVAAAALLFVATPLATAATATASQVTTQTVAAATPTTAAAAVKATAAVTPQPAPKQVETTEHVVERGDTLWSLAERHLGSGARYVELAELNRATLGANPGFLTVGEVIEIPAPTKSATVSESDTVVTVQRGDTLSGIAQEELGDANKYPEIVEASKDTVQSGGRRLSDPDVILPGWKVTIPDAAADAPKVGTADSGTADVEPPPAEPPAAAEQAEPVPHAPAPTAAPELADPQEQASPTPEQPAPTAETADEEIRDDGADDTNPAWLLAGLTGGGAVLAGGLFLAVRARRAAQWRARRPGRTIAVPQPELAPVEKTLTTVGAPASVDVEMMDQALRRLAASTSAASSVMPEVAAAELASRVLTVHLSSPTELGPPWIGSADRLRWTLPAETDLDQIGDLDPDQPAPCPLLVTIGTGDNGSVWLLNIENLSLSITGDPTFGRDFARYLAAEIACNPWSHGVRVDLVGVAQEVAPMSADRIHVYTGGEDGPDADALVHAIAMIDASADVGADVATARARQDGADAWPARLLLVDAAEELPVLDQLLETVEQHPGRTGTSVVVHGERANTPGLVLHVTDNGRLTLPHAGLDLVAVGLTSDEAQGCAALLAQSEDLTDAPMPVDEDADQGWRAWSDEAGSLRDEHTIARNEPAVDDHAVSVLDGDDDDYLQQAATTRADLDALAPKVPAQVRDAVAESDPTLDDDLAMWWSKSCALPRLTLLGPVGARTRGTPVTKRKPYYTEMLAYLACRVHGATPDELAEAFSISPAKARDYVRILRDWLGTNPRTGQAHLPDARKAPAAIARGVGVYQVLDLLVDADLFRRLRVRGESRGPDGVEDLLKALQLVQGRPFDRLRNGGWSWLSEGDRLDQHMICGIVDVAHLVTTFSLQAGDTRKARLAAETAALAAPDEEIPRLDLAAVADAEGHTSEADRILRDEVCNRSDDEGAPPELSLRTQEILAGRDWHQRTRKAS